MPTEKQCDAEYHCGIGNLLSTAYLRKFTQIEMGKCKTKFPTFREWYLTLSEAQKQRVDRMLKDAYSD